MQNKWEWPTTPLYKVSILKYHILLLMLLLYSIGASATAVKVEAGVSNVPLAQASATGPEAKAEAGVSWKCFGASAGAYLGELKAGPLGVRAGV